MIEDLIGKAVADDYDAIDELVRLAAADPAALTPHLGRLHDLDLLWPPALYRGADAALVRRVVERVDGGHAGGSLNHLLLLLATTRDPLAEQALRRWQQHPPVDTDRLFVGPLDYAREGGWVPLPDGGRRELCSLTAYAWKPEPATPAGGGPLCPWCASPLWILADLDTTEPRAGAALAHTGWAGRLRIATCHLCSCYGTLFCRVTGDGGVEWWPANTRAADMPVDEPEDPPAVLPAIGPRRASPYQASAWERGGSTLGGHPQWIQDAEHPDCPACGEAMDYVGLIGGADIDDFGEGAHYLHLHAPCGLAAVNYQQS